LKTKMVDTRKTIVGVGSALVDILAHEDDAFLTEAGAVKGGMIYVEKSHIEQTLARISGRPAIVPGGSACNTVVGVSRLGGKARFVGKRGGGKMGDFFENALRANNVDPRLFRSEVSTGRVLSIITPDADPVKRRGMLDVLNQFFADKNAFLRGPSPRLLSTHIVKFKVYRHWQLHLWELHGEPKTWQRQLERHLAEQPVLAVISGLGGRTWQPIHAFCEKEALPCLFPNVEAPPAGADHDFYSLYFSQGVLLEARLIARGILNPHGGDVPKLVRQIYRVGDSGELAARALAASLAQHGITVRNHALVEGVPSGQSVAAAVRQAADADALVLWLRADDIAALKGVPPPTGTVKSLSIVEAFPSLKAQVLSGLSTIINPSGVFNSQACCSTRTPFVANTKKHEKITAKMETRNNFIRDPLLKRLNEKV